MLAENSAPADNSENHDAVAPSSDGGTSTLFIGIRYVFVGVLLVLIGVLALIGKNYFDTSENEVKGLKNEVKGLQIEKEELMKQLELSAGCQAEKSKLEGLMVSKLEDLLDSNPDEVLRMELEKFKRELEAQVKLASSQLEQKELEVQAKLHRWQLGQKIRGGLEFKGTCYTTFAYNFENVLLLTFTSNGWFKDRVTHSKYKAWVKEWSSTDNKDTFWDDKNIKKMFGEPERLDLLMNHFRNMEKENANPVIFSTLSSKELIESLMLHAGFITNLEVFVKVGSLGRQYRAEKILESLIRTKNVEWYEVMFFDNHEDEKLESPSFNAEELPERELKATLEKIEGMIRKDCEN